MADEVGARTGQNLVIGRFPARERGGTRDCPQFVVHICAGEDGNNAWQFLRAVGFDRIDFRVCVWTTDVFRVKHTREFQVVDIGGNTLEQARVLHPFHRATEVFLRSFGPFGGLLYFGGFLNRCAHFCVCPFLAACSTASTICE